MQLPGSGAHSSFRPLGRILETIMRHMPKSSPPRWAAIELPPKKSLGRWFAFGILCGMVGVACFVDRFPLLMG